VSPHLLLWAKLGQDDYKFRHPLVCHLIDVAAVAQQLWNLVQRDAQRRRLASQLGLSPDEAGRWLAFWVGAHDIGKAAPCFQDKDRSGAARLALTAKGFNFPPGSDVPHGVIGARSLAELLAEQNLWPAIPVPLSRRIAVAVGGHHGLFPSPAEWFDLGETVLGNERWSEARKVILAILADETGVSGLRPPTAPPDDQQAFFMFLAGLTSVADWIGSNKEFFPSATESVDLSAYRPDARTRACIALDKLGWTGQVWQDHSPRTFSSLFPKIEIPRPLQQYVQALAARLTAPALVLIEAPMGEGKTEAALFLANHWIETMGRQGLYVALPTMATSNQMFDRVGAFLEVLSGKKNLMLQHGKAALNDYFEHLKYAARLYDDEKQPSAVVAEQWFAENKKHGLLAPYGVGTIDQALLAVLQTRHVFVRLFGLAGKCVILDEVHAYDAYMTTLMERLLRWLAALGCPVVLLSATLPRDKRLKLLRAYAGDALPEPDDAPYPRVTSTAVGNLIEVSHVDADRARDRTVLLGWAGESELAERLRLSLVGGGCAAVIRNTVGLAQETYKRLRDALKEHGIEVELFHARFPFGRRREIETAVLKRFGKDGGPAQRDKRVLVATQVVEQSLDLDFDIMVSDVAPVDLVLQRAGRLQRHERGPRPTGVAQPRLWLMEPGEKDGLPDFGPSEFVYARYVLLRSYIALKAVEAIRLPDDLEHFVEQVYGTDGLPVPPGWQAALDQAKRELDEEQRSQRKKAKGVMIHRPDDEDLLRQQNAQLDEDNPEAANKIRAATRDTDPTVQVVLVYHLDGCDYR
jgi:CRISPR-associated endonuclease/helicase Cas3